MGHVKLEQRNDGKGCAQFLYLPLSEPRVVRILISQRSRLDPLFYPSAETVDFNSTAGVYVTGDPVTNTFLDLDRLIELAGLNEQEMYVVNKLMYGYSCLDISEIKKWTLDTVKHIFRRSVAKIVHANYVLWEDTYCNAKISDRCVK